MTDAREEILGRVRTALGRGPSGGEPQDAVPRLYRRRGDETREEVVERFVERLVDYRARVERTSDAELPGAVAAALRREGVRRLAIPPDLPAAWLPDTVATVRDDDLSARELDAVDGVLTGCAAAIAQTGTILLDGGPRQGRRALTLVPDYHLCIVEERQIVSLVPEAIELLQEAARSGRPITLISGPSATSDIELIRVEGVHGPRRLEVLLVSRPH